MKMSKGEEKKKVRGKIVFLLVFLVVGVLAAAQILVANRLATQGDLIRKYETEAHWMNEKNQKVENEIIKLSSLSHIASRSAELAFIENISILYLPKPVVVAVKE